MLQQHFSHQQEMPFQFCYENYATMNIHPDYSKFVIQMKWQCVHHFRQYVVIFKIWCREWVCNWHKALRNGIKFTLCILSHLDLVTHLKKNLKWWQLPIFLTYQKKKILRGYCKFCIILFLSFMNLNLNNAFYFRLYRKRWCYQNTYLWQNNFCVQHLVGTCYVIIHLFSLFQVLGKVRQ